MMIVTIIIMVVMVAIVTDSSDNNNDDDNDGPRAQDPDARQDVIMVFAPGLACYKHNY